VTTRIRERMEPLLNEAVDAPWNWRDTLTWEALDENAESLVYQARTPHGVYTERVLGDSGKWYVFYTPNGKPERRLGMHPKFGKSDARGIAQAHHEALTASVRQIGFTSPEAKALFSAEWQKWFGKPMKPVRKGGENYGFRLRDETEHAAADAISRTHPGLISGWDRYLLP
jgi:hypothetical protein